MAYNQLANKEDIAMTLTTKKWIKKTQSLLIDAGLDPSWATSYSVLADYDTPEEFVEKCSKSYQPSKSEPFVYTPNGI